MGSRFRKVFSAGSLAVAVCSTLLAMTAGAPSVAQAAASACNRACLEGFVDKYLAAMVAHDPARLPKTANVKFTENGQTLKLGDALWGTAEGLGDYKLYFADPTAGQIGFFGTVRESGRLALLALRLKVEKNRISEIETVVARAQGAAPGGGGASASGGAGANAATGQGNNGPGSNPSASRFADMKAQPIFNEALAADDHPSREELVRIANSYFEGLEQETGRLTPFDPNCTRIENGSITANNPDSPRPMGRMTCGQQFDTGFSKFITAVRERRYPVVDVERGLVFAQIFFDHAGTVKTVKMTDGTTMTVPPPFDAPYTFIIDELFKIRNGKITRIEAVLIPVPYGMPSGWAKK